MIKNVKVKKISVADNISVRSVAIETDLGTVETPLLSLSSTDINALVDVPTTIDIKDDIVVLTNAKWLRERAVLDGKLSLEYIGSKIEDLKHKLSGNIKILLALIQPGKKFVSSLGNEKKIEFVHKAVEYQINLGFSDVVVPDVELGVSDYIKLLDQLTRRHQDVNLIPVIKADSKQHLSSIIEKEIINTVLVLLGAKEDLSYYRSVSTNFLNHLDKDIFFLGVSNARIIRIPKLSGIADLAPVQIFTPFCGIDSSVVISNPYPKPQPKDFSEKYQKLKERVNRLHILNPLTLQYERFVELKDRLSQYVETIKKYIRVDDDIVLKHDILPNLGDLYEIPSPSNVEAVEIYEKKLSRVTKLFRVINLAILETEYDQLARDIREGNVKEYLRRRKFLNELFNLDITRFFK
jgi:hypothetical protein